MTMEIDLHKFVIALVQIFLEENSKKFRDTLFEQFDSRRTLMLEIVGCLAPKDPLSLLSYVTIGHQKAKKVTKVEIRGWFKYNVENENIFK